MPKTDIDYANTIIYKITCKDKSIKDVYVGYTTNFVQRKHAHKQNCINNKSAGYTCKLYEAIRENGGWDNWLMEIITYFECKDQYEARKKEQEYFISLNATLNNIEPLPKPKIVVPKHVVPKIVVPKHVVPNNIIMEIKDIFFCKTCNIHCISKTHLDDHSRTKKHIKNLSKNENDTLKTLKNAKKFICKSCDFECYKKSEWERHIIRRKHIRIQKNTEKTPILSSYICSKCNKLYKYHSGLWKHSKTCTSEHNEEIHLSEHTISEDTVSENTISENTIIQNNNSINTIINDNEQFKKFMLEVVKSNNDLQQQNNDLHKQMVDMCKNNNITNNINNNSHNKTFNLHFFLNEQCKDAMNISDFANSITLELSDLESVGELGYVEGITKIMLDKLNSMDIYKRPIHCSDAKREILYVKDHDVWEKEERNNPKLRYAIKTISFNNMKLMGLWSSTYPESLDGESYLNDKYMKLIKQSTGGNGEISDSEDKIIRRIAKEIVIGKNKM